MNESIQSPTAGPDSGTHTPTAGSGGTHRLAAHRLGGGDQRPEDNGALVPQQRGETPPQGPEPTEPEGRTRDAQGRFSRRTPFAPLPDLVAGLSAVPGGLGVERPTAFTFAGVHWDTADAAVDGAPIGFRLASELHQTAARPTSTST
jgi:hypothetical protein